MTAATGPEKLIYWEVVSATGVRPDLDGEDALLAFPTFDDLWAKYPETTYSMADVQVSFAPRSAVDTTFLDHVAPPAGVFTQSPTTHQATGPGLARCICGKSWPCDKAGEQLSKDLVTLRAVEPEWPDFDASPSPN